MLRIRYDGRETVFEYRVERKDVKEKVNEHCIHWRFEGVSDPKDRFKFTKREIPLSILRIEWVEGDPANPTSVEPLDAYELLGVPRPPEPKVDPTPAPEPAPAPHPAPPA